MHGVADLVGSYGYVFLFLLISIESFGVPLPGETALVSAAALAARGQLNIALVIVTAAAGAVIGDNAGYWIGRRGGIALVRRYGRRVGLDEAKLARVQRFFARHGAKTVFIGRFIALLRSWVAALGVVVVLGARWLRGNSARIGDALSARWQRIASSPRFAYVRARHPRLWSFVAGRMARGDYLGLHLTIGLVAAVPSYRRWWIGLVGWVAANAGGALLDWILERVIHRPRPIGAGALLSGTSFSFPRSHAMGLLIGYGMLRIS